MKDSYTIAAGYVYRFYQSLVDAGVSEEAIYAATHLKKSDLGNPDDRILVDKYIQLGKVSPELTHLPEIGLILGQRANFKNIGIMYQLPSQCDTIEDSLLYTSKYSNLINETRRTGFEKGESTAEWSAQYMHPKYVCITTIEFESCQALRILKCLFGKNFKPVQMKFQHEAPRYVKKYYDIFKTALLFGQDKSSIVFDKRRLRTPNPDPQPYIKKLLMKHADTLMKDIEKNHMFQDKVKKVIIRYLGAGKANLAVISNELNLSSRTVYRKLKKENMSYTELLNNVQKRLAHDYLQDDSFSIDDISHLLGFSESSAFHRAFKRWFGTNPSRYRQKITSADFPHHSN